MRLAIGHPAAAVIVAAALAGMAGIIAFSRPAYRPQQPQHVVTTTPAVTRR
jgi:hypothetical protein